MRGRALCTSHFIQTLGSPRHPALPKGLLGSYSPGTCALPPQLPFGFLKPLKEPEKNPPRQGTWAETRPVSMVTVGFQVDTVASAGAPAG